MNNATASNGFKKAPTLKQQREERAALIRELGWAPEGPTAADRYVATTGELTQLVRERQAR